MFNSIYEVKITGKDLDRFIKQMYRLNINLYDIKYKGKSIYVKVDSVSYNKLINIKTIYEIEVVRFYGLAYFIDYFKRNYIFLSFVMFGFLVLLILTRIIFDIEVVHSKKDIRELIYEELYNHGLKKGHFILSYDDTEKIADDIVRNHKDKIEWLEIERVGVKYIVKVEERVINKENSNISNRDLIAKKDGIITSINASSGEIRKKVNDYVKRGEVIVSGNITKDEKIKKTVGAKGKVFAEVWYEAKVNIPLHYREVIKDSKIKNNINLFFLDRKIPFFNTGKTVESDNVIYLKNKIFPIGLSISKDRKIQIIDDIYTIEEASNKAISLAEEKIKKNLSDNERIISRKKLKIQLNGSTILVRVFFKVNEDITTYKNITKEDLDKLKKLEKIQEKDR